MQYPQSRHVNNSVLPRLAEGHACVHVAGVYVYGSPRVGDRSWASVYAL